MMKYKIEISENYLDRESKRMFYNDLSLKGWIEKYCKKNKIELHTSEDDLILGFKSANQLYCFTRRGNGIFPYFEFL